MNSKPIHIFFIFYNFGLGGIQQKIADMTSALSGYDSRNYISHIILKDPSDFTITPLNNTSKIRFHISPFRSKIFFPVFLFIQFLTFRPNSAITYAPLLVLYCLLSKFFSLCFHSKIIVSQDNILSMDNMHPFTRSPFPNWLINKLYSATHHIIVQTHTVKADLIAHYGIPESKIHIIPNWVIHMTTSKTKPIDIIYCGRFAKQKQLDIMLFVISEVQKHFSNVRCILIGSGEEEKMTRTLIGEYSLERNVTLYPATQKARWYISRSKIFLLTSKHEGHPMAVVESMFSKTVPVVLNHPGAHDYIRTGITGFIEPDSSHLVKRITGLLKNRALLNRIAQNAHFDSVNVYNRDLIHKTLDYLTL